MVAQFLTLVEAVRHYRFYQRKFRRRPAGYEPRTALIAPCKGIDTTFERNISSFFAQRYRDYELFFVVESEDDAAYGKLQEIIAEHDEVKAHLVVAGMGTTSSQKLHNLLAAGERVDDSFEVLAFVDSDACLSGDYLLNLVYPLRRDEVGATTGYRWFVPTDEQLSSKVLSAMNAFFAGQMGPHNWNTTWGGAMAIERELFGRAKVAEFWREACTDDYSLTRAVWEQKKIVEFVPACFAASYEQMSWNELFRFARRQFLITRVYMPHLWWLALLGLGHYLVGFWGAFVLTIVWAVMDSAYAIVGAVLAFSFLANGMVKAILRQCFIHEVLERDAARLLGPALIDVMAQPVVAILSIFCLLASGLSRKMEWRGRKYVLRGMRDVEVVAGEGMRHEA